MTITLRRASPPLFLLLACTAAAEQPLGTAFTYQGRLDQGGKPANGSHDLRFRLFNAETGGDSIGPTICADNTAVTDGLFTTSLDFGAPGGAARWLEIGVRADTGLGCAVLTGYTTLAPRQPLTPAPQALFSAAPWQSAGTNTFFTGGNVGIGTAAPAHALHNTGTYFGFGDVRLHAFEGVGQTGTAYIQARDDSGTSNLELVLRSQSQGLAVDAIRVKSAGRVNIGPMFGSGARLTVRAVPGDGRIFEARDGSSAAMFYVEESGGLFAPALPNIGDFRNMQYDEFDGRIGWDTSSRRYKTNIQPLEDDFARILRLEPKAYTRINNERADRREIGYIAEEVHDLGLGRLVEYDKESRPDGVNYEKMVLYLNEVVKQQQAQIDELEKQVQEVKSMQSKELRAMTGTIAR